MEKKKMKKTNFRSFVSLIRLNKNIRNIYV